ncbi:MdtA/MuxA family multidrug efflux RND transporter periplasmic adaptor subunit [Eoetvoesiella caeni]
MPEPGFALSRPSRTRKWVVGLVVLAVLAGGAYWIFGKPPGGAAPGGFGARGAAMGFAKVPVKIAVAQSEPINVVLKAIGTVTAYNTVTVNSQVAGQLKKVAFQDGQKVQAGDLLFQIDPRAYQVQLDQALGQQKQNQAQLDNARRDLQRYQLLYKQNSIAKQQVDTQAALVQQYLGSQKSDQAAVDSARLQLSYTQITAPISGRVGFRSVDEGNLVSTSSTTGLVVITQTQPISAIFTLPQSQLAQVLEQMRAGQTLRVDLYDRDDIKKLATGELMSVDNQIDVATGTVKFKARFANEDEALFPNQFVNVRLLVSTQAGAVVIPTAALLQGSIGGFVYVVDDGNKVHIQPVTAGTIDGARVAIVKGLEAGQKVVTEGVDRLKEGAEVEVVTPEAQAEVARKADEAKKAAKPARGGPAGGRRH